MSMMGGFGGHSASRGQVDEEVFGAVYDQKVILRLFPFILPYKKMVVVSVIAMLIYTVTQVAVPWIIALAIDDYMYPVGDFQGLTWIVGLFIVVAFVNWATNYIQQYSMEKVGQGVLYKLRGALFGHVQKQSLSYFDKTEVGRLMSRVQGDVGQLQEFSALVVMTLGELLSLVGIVVALLILNVKLGLITMVVIPMLVAIMVVWQRYARKAFIEVRRCISIVNGAFNENISGVRVVLGMNRQRRNLEIFDGKNKDHRWSNIIAGRYSAGLMPGVDI
ncbi:MAG: ABC transporter transmembrane domain-containing protein, partial [Chloroflexota bacterium]|nr:ABC transporter transmembrane domain-containing protein [Chloroflexota bacterium]